MKKYEISFGFNLILICFWCANMITLEAFRPETKEEVPWDTFFNAFPILSVAIAIILALVLVIWGSRLLQLFWNRFISNIFALREISFQEAFALTLVLSFCSM